MNGRLVYRSDLTAADRAAMSKLLDTHFDGVTAETFERDLAAKNWTVLIEPHDRLVGFSTMKAFKATIDGELLPVVCSGDTIGSREAWG